MRLAKTKNLGFTLIELLVVVAILGIISAIGTLSYQGYVTAAKKKSAQNVLMQAALCQLEYFSDNNTNYVADKCTIANAKTKATGFGTTTTSYKLQDALLGGQDNFNEAADLLRNRRADLMKIKIQQGHHESVFFE